jgi:flagellar operon protein
LIRPTNGVPLGLVGGDRSVESKDAQVQVGQSDFVGLLRRERDLGVKSEDLKFSSHAKQRLESRGLDLSDSDMSRLSRGVSSLRSKSVRDGLVVVGDHRFVVSVENKTVITVLSSSDREVFTNIQGVAFE